MSQQSPVPDWFGRADPGMRPIGPPAPPTTPPTRGGGSGCLGLALGLLIATGAFVYGYSEHHRAERFRVRAEQAEQALAERPTPRADPIPVLPPLPAPIATPTEPERSAQLAPDAAEPTGRSADDMIRVLTPIRSRLRACYEVALGRDPDANGRINTKITIAPDGSVRSVTAETTGRLAASVGSCVVAVIKTVHFPPQSETTIVSYPVVFSAN